MIDKIWLYLRMIKFPHSVFALPFALTAALIASAGFPPPGQTFWVIVAMVGARSGAMGLNRVIDSEIDALNPRTKDREVPSKKIKSGDALIFSIISLGALVLAAYMLNPLCLKLSPVAIALVVFYSYTKRFTWASHFILGLVLSAAPLGAWIAIRGEIDVRILPLVLSVAFWLPGFDILYALQDLEFDRFQGLHSIPVRFGIAPALALSRLLHFLSWVCLLLTGVVFDLGPAYWVGICVVAVLFVYEHSLVKAADLRRLDVAFFNMNGYISLTVFAFTVLNYLYK